MSNGATTERREKLSESDFDRIGAFVLEQSGIRMPTSSRPLLEELLGQRMAALSMATFSRYFKWVLDPMNGGVELMHLIEVAMAADIPFFSEPSHFEYLVQHALPDIIKHHGAGVRQPLMVWSAGCAAGEEPYTLAMVLSEFGEHYPGFKFDYLILATDISTRIMEKAKAAIFNREKVGPVPMPLKKKYLLRSRDREKKVVRITPELRAKVRFRQINFMDEEFGLREKMEILFCRNILGLYAPEHREEIVNKLCRYLTPGGYLFLGESENLDAIRTPLVQAAPAIYQLPG